MSEELTLWLDWVKKKADWLDPTIPVEDQWLTDRDKDALLTGQDPPSSPFNYYSQPITKTKKTWPLLPWYMKKD